jgi:tRNA uridine 5-carboxymethylaminomethyl modification enzyme
VPDEQWRRFEAKREAIERERQRLRRTWVRPGEIDAALLHRVLGDEMRREATALDLLARPRVTYRSLLELPGLGPGAEDPQVCEQVEIQAKYAGYIERQREEIERQRAQEALQLPRDLDFDQVRGLSAEVREKFSRSRPLTVGQAARIPGVTPAAVSLLLIHLKRKSA